MAQHVTFTCSLAEPSKPEEIELESRRSEEAIIMAGNHLIDSSPSSDRSDRFDLHGRDEGLEKQTPFEFDQENNSSLMNGGSLTRREEKEVSVFAWFPYPASAYNIIRQLPSPHPSYHKLCHIAAASFLQNSV